MGSFKSFLQRKNIVFSLRRYGIDAMGAMAQGLFCSLLIGTIINTIGTQFHIAWLTTPVANVGGIEYTVGGQVFKTHYLHGEPPFAWADYQAWTR